jgi:hypothetical protein
MNRVEFALEQLLDSRINTAITFDDMNSAYYNIDEPSIEHAEIYKNYFVELLNAIQTITPKQFKCLIEVKDNLAFVDFVENGQDVSLCGIRFGYTQDISTTENIDEYSKYGPWSVYGPFSVNLKMADLSDCMRILECFIDVFRRIENDTEGGIPMNLTESMDNVWKDVLNEALYDPWKGFKFQKGDIVKVIKDTPLNNMPLGYQSPNRLGACGKITFVALCEERPYYFVEFKDGDRGRYYPSWCLTKN